MNCATCLHWIADDPQHPLRGLGACGRLRFGMYDPDVELEGELAVVLEGSMFKCKADFGCVLHEAS